MHDANIPEMPRPPRRGRETITWLALAAMTLAAVILCVYAAAHGGTD